MLSYTVNEVIEAYCGAALPGQQREDFQKTEEMDLELPNTFENGLNVWQDATNWFN